MKDIDPYEVPCPICAAPAGQPCVDVASGFVVEKLIAHMYRSVVAQEVGR